MPSNLKLATINSAIDVNAAIGGLHLARRLLRQAGARKAAGAVSRALKSAEGAARHVKHRLIASGQVA